MMRERMRKLMALLATWWAVFRHKRAPKFQRVMIPACQGLGDSFHNLMERLWIGPRVRSYFASIHADCGCEGRRRWLNERAHRWVWWLYLPPKNQPFLTLVMAHWRDWEGVWSTATTALFQARDAGILDRFEILVIDQSPEHESGRLIVEHLAKHTNKVRVIPYTEAIGVACAKNAAFRLQETVQGGKRRQPVIQSDWTMVADCHIELEPGALAKAFWFALRHRFDRSFFCGPMMTTALGNQVATGMDCAWRRQQFGRWVHDPRGQHPNQPPFQVRNVNGGLTLSRTDAAILSHPLSRGFGLESTANVAVSRMRGQKLMCLPFLRWTHRFGRSFSESVGQRNDGEERVRNAALNFAMCGAFGEIERMRAYFTTPHKERVRGELQDFAVWSAEKFDGIVAQAIADHEAWKAATDPNGLEVKFRLAVQKPSDLNEHLVTLRRLASQCEHVTEFSNKYGTATLAFLAGGVRKLVNINPKPCPACRESFIEQIRGAAEFVHITADSKAIPPIDETDLLFIDSEHTAEQLRAELALHADRVRGWIVLHDTAKKSKFHGMLVALDEFLAAHPEWSIVERYENNHGLIVLGRVGQPTGDPPDTSNKVGLDDSTHLTVFERQEVLA